METTTWKLQLVPVKNGDGSALLNQTEPVRGHGLDDSLFTKVQAWLSSDDVISKRVDGSFLEGNVNATVSDAECKELRGHIEGREYMRVPWKRWAEVWRTFRTSAPDEWLEANVKLYVCQLPLFASAERGTQTATAVPPLDVLGTDGQHVVDVMRQSLSPSAVVQTANVWMNIHGTCTNWHYDSFPNVLTVASGRKRVFVVSPAFTKYMHARSIADPLYSNHSELQGFAWDEGNGLVVTSLQCPGQDPASTTVSPPSPVELERTPVMFYADVMPGDFVYIPEGWWHRVESDAQTFAINVWVHGYASWVRKNCHTCICSPPVLEYITRTTLVAVLDDHVLSIRKERRQSALESVQRVACSEQLGAHIANGEIGVEDVPMLLGCLLSETKPQQQLHIEATVLHLLCLSLPESATYALWSNLYAEHSSTLRLVLTFLSEVDGDFSMEKLVIVDAVTSSWDTAEAALPEEMQELYERMFSLVAVDVRLQWWNAKAALRLKLHKQCTADLLS